MCCLCPEFFADTDEAIAHLRVEHSLGGTTDADVRYAASIMAHPSYTGTNV